MSRIFLLALSQSEFPIGRSMDEVYFEILAEKHQILPFSPLFFMMNSVHDSLKRSADYLSTCNNGTSVGFG